MKYTIKVWSIQLMFGVYKVRSIPGLEYTRFRVYKVRSTQGLEHTRFGQTIRNPCYFTRIDH